MASINTQPGIQRNVNETGADASAKCTFYRLRDFYAAPTESAHSWPTSMLCGRMFLLHNTWRESSFVDVISLRFTFSKIFSLIRTRVGVLETPQGTWDLHQNLCLHSTCSNKSRTISTDTNVCAACIAVIVVNFVLWNGGLSYAPLLSASKHLVKADLHQLISTRLSENASDIRIKKRKKFILFTFILEWKLKPR